MALRLNEDEHIDRVLAAIPTQHITHVVDTIPNNRLERSDTHFSHTWCWWAPVMNEIFRC